MVLTPTKIIPLNFKAPDFRLLDVVSDEMKTLNDLKSDVATVVMFICNHCPYVIHIKEDLVQLANDYQLKGVRFIAINSNDVIKYPDDSPENMKKDVNEFNYPFPYLFDKTQEVAKAYYAECTPDFSIFDKELKCVYRGQLDDSRPGNNIPVTGNDIRNVLDSLISGTTIDSLQKQSIGCNIKWK